MQRLKSVLGYAAAGLTVLVAVLVPFRLIDVFTRGVAATGVQVAPHFTGGDVVKTLPRTGYRIEVHQPVRKRAPLQQGHSFVQLTFTPATALPERVDERVDLDNDGAPDARVQFQPSKPDLRMDIEPLNSRVLPLRNAGKEDFTALIARVNDGIVVRVPVR